MERARFRNEEAGWRLLYVCNPQVWLGSVCLGNTRDMRVSRSCQRGGAAVDRSLGHEESGQRIQPRSRRIPQATSNKESLGARRISGAGHSLYAGCLGSARLPRSTHREDSRCIQNAGASRASLSVEQGPAARPGKSCEGASASGRCPREDSRPTAPAPNPLQAWARVHAGKHAIQLGAESQGSEAIAHLSGMQGARGADRQTQARAASHTRAAGSQDGRATREAA
jgi:hypothetical protein